MRKLALSDEILLSVDKAARYIGGEVNSVMKKFRRDRCPCGVLFSGCLRDRHVQPWYDASL